VRSRLQALARQPFVGVVVELVGLVGGAAHNGKVATVRARPGRLSALSVSHSKSGLYGAFVWGRRALNRKNGGSRPGQVLRSLPEKERFELELLESGKRMDVKLATGGAAIKCPSPLNVLKDTYDHSCY
jgi:hypothetical protein